MMWSPQWPAGCWDLLCSALPPPVHRIGVMPGAFGPMVQYSRHGHLRGITDGYKGCQPNFHKWARAAYRQDALPTLSLLPGNLIVEALPSHKIFQAMEVEPKWNLWSCMDFAQVLKVTCHHTCGTRVGSQWRLRSLAVLNGSHVDAPRLPTCHQIATPCQISPDSAHCAANILSAWIEGTW